jgi:hypothetical protein
MNQWPDTAETRGWARGRLVIETTIVLVVAVLAACLALQGWKSRSVLFDLLTSISAAQELVDTGRLPDRGVITSFGSFTSPGAVWLELPGVLVFREPRLFQYVGSVLLFFGTLLGIFVLTRRYLGPRCALLAVVLYAFSEPGLSAASSLWQRYPLHGFYVWMIYWAARWVDEDNSYFLGLSLLTWFIGMFVFLEITPAIVAIPLLWLLSLPSVSIRPIVAAVVLAVVVWFPYLRFEASRNFVDLRSQVLRVPLWPVDYQRSWCDPSVAPAEWTSPAVPIDPGSTESERGPLALSLRQRMSEKVRLIVGDLLLANFGKSRFAGIFAVALFLLALIGTVALFTSTGVPLANGRNPAGVASVVLGVAVIAMVTAAIFNEVLAAKFLSPDGVLTSSTVQGIRWLQATLLTAGVVFAAYSRTIARVVIRIHQEMSARATTTWPVAIGLMVPWLTLLLLAESERRFLWLWPIQVIVLAAAVIHIAARIGASRWVPVGSLALVIIVAANPVTLSRLQSWARDGWAGEDAIEVQVVDRLAALINAHNESRASVGYEIDIWRFKAATNVVDPRYKVGADFDLLLKYRHGIVNLNRCAEGFSAQDAYRVVQVKELEGSDPEGRDRIIAPRSGDFQLADQIGVYQILHRP